MTLLELAKQYESDVETRIECIKDECNMGIKEADSDEVGHWEVTLRIIRKTIAEHKRMAKQKVGNWIDKEVAFYDFIWAYGVNACTDCINSELFEDFTAGGNKFEEMKKLILKKFPTKEIALKEFEENSEFEIEEITE